MVGSSKLAPAGEPLNPYASRGSNPRLARARQACCSLVCEPCPGQAAPPEPAAELLRADRAGRPHDTPVGGGREDGRRRAKDGCGRRLLVAHGRAAVATRRRAAARCRAAAVAARDVGHPAAREVRRTLTLTLALALNPDPRH